MEKNHISHASGGNPQQQPPDLPGHTALFPGKTGEGGWLPLWLHQADTAGVMGYLVRNRLPGLVKAALGEAVPEEDLERYCVFLGLVHDIGKMTPVMAEKLLRNDAGIKSRLEEAGFFIPRREDFGPDAPLSPHALAGQAVLLDGGCPYGTAVIIGAHHGKPEGMGGNSRRQTRALPFNYYADSDAGSPRALLWKGAREGWIRLALEAAGYGSLDSLPEPSRSQQMLFAGLLQEADWIASDTSCFPLIQAGSTGGGISPRERLEEALGKLALPDMWQPREMGPGGFRETFGFAASPMQEAAMGIVSGADSPGIMILEAPMGSGKTEAALAMAQTAAAKTGCGGLFFGMPTQATADGIFGRLESWAGKQGGCHSIRLAHGASALNAGYRGLPREAGEGGVFVHEWFGRDKTALLADFVAGTTDRLLMAALKQKHVMMRLLGLAGKAVILDEVHSCNPRMNAYMDRVLNWLGRYGTPVVVLSATLPSARREAMVREYLGGAFPEGAPCAGEGSYPLLTWTDGGAVRQAPLPAGGGGSVVRTERLPDSGLAGFLGERLSEGGCAGVIVNTVKRSQALARSLKEALPGMEVALLHAGFAAPDRSERERAVIARTGKGSAPADRDGLIVVGTQVLEQSLDIDFDVMATDPCPMDLLLQRAGRLHRHGRERPGKLEEPVLAVLGDGRPDRGSEAVYGRWLLMRTAAFLPRAISLPGDIPGLMEAVYGEPGEPLGPQEREAREEYRTEEASAGREAGPFRLGPPEPKGPLRFPSHIKGMVDGDVANAQAEAAVRGSEPSVEVLVLARRDDGGIGFLPWTGGGALDPDRPLTGEEALLAARQKLRLPRALCTPSAIGATIRALEGAGIPARWLKGPLLEGRLVLLLDEGLSAEAEGLDLRYDREYGLLHGKEA